MSFDPHDLFEGFGPPPASRDLKRRALAAARAEPLETPGRPPVRSLVDRLWESRSLRLGWTAAVVLLLAAHLLLAAPSPPAGRGDAVERTADAARTADADPHLLRALRRHPPRRTTVRMTELRALTTDPIPRPGVPPAFPEGGSA